VSEQVWVTLIAAGPPTLASVLWYLAHRRLRKSVGASPGVPLSELIHRLERQSDRRFDRLEGRLDRIDGRVERLSDVQSQMRERLARLERTDAGRLWSPNT
jgi:hypothetical protein